MIINQDLPKNWVLTDMETIRLDLHEGITPNKYPDQKFELYSVPQFEFGKPEIAYGKEIGSNKQVISRDTVLLCKINPRINRVWITRDYYSLKKICSTEWIPFFQLTGLNSKYLSYFLQNPIFREFLSINVSGVGGSLTRTKPSAFKDYPFPLPPLPEQNEIVAKIEELFSELDNGVESLKKAWEQLKTYRQAVLKYAFEGKLTQEWREQQIQAGNPPESAERLLARIKKERETQYQKQMEAWQEACEQAKKDGSKKPAKPKKPKDLPPLTEKELAELSVLPEGWGWVKLFQFCKEITDGDHQPPPKSLSGIPFITISNIQNNQIDFSSTFYVNEYYYSNLKNSRRPEKGDILYTVTGSYGIPVLIDFQQKFCFQRHIGLIRPYEIVSKKYVFYLLQSNIVYQQAKKVATGTAQKTVPLEGLRNFKIPLSTNAEQHRIVSEIETRLSVCDQLEQTIEDSLKKAEGLRQSILKKAFEGELTREWRKAHPELVSGENSAERLLARIQAEKEKNSPQRRRGR